MKKVILVLAMVLAVVIRTATASADGFDPRRQVSGEGSYLDVDAGTPVAGAYYNFVDGSVKQGPCHYNALPQRARVWSSVVYPNSGEAAGMPACDPAGALFGGSPPSHPVAPSAPAAPVYQVPTGPAPAQVVPGQGAFRPAQPAPNWDNTTNCNPGEVIAPSATVPMPYKQSGVVGACDSLTVVVPPGYNLVLDAQMGRVNGVTYPFPLHVYGPGTYTVGFLNGALFVGPTEHAHARFANLRDVVGPARGIPYQPMAPAGW